MTGGSGRKASLHQPATYQVRVPGHLDESWSDWAGGLLIQCECAADGSPVTTLTGKLDQAALQGLLRRLYAQGLPLESVICLGCGCENGDCACTWAGGDRREEEAIR